jgi:hypothetical protein
MAQLIGNEWLLVNGTKAVVICGRTDSDGFGCVHSKQSPNGSGMLGRSRPNAIVTTNRIAGASG